MAFGISSSTMSDHGLFTGTNQMSSPSRGRTALIPNAPWKLGDQKFYY